MFLKDEARQEETNSENNAGNREENEPENTAPFEEVVELDVAGWRRLAEIPEEQQRCADDESEHAQPSRCEPRESHSFLFTSEVKKSEFLEISKNPTIDFFFWKFWSTYNFIFLSRTREKRERKKSSLIFISEIYKKLKFPELHITYVINP